MSPRCLSWVALLFAFLGMAGCQKAIPGRNPTQERLYKIGKAYIQTCYQLERGPESFAEIQPNIEGAESENMLVSPNDGEPFVILWGVDFARLPPGASDPFTVGGYEKKGVDGIRYV